MLVIHEKITVEDALNFEGDNFIFFKQIFSRVCELCSRDIDDTANLKKNYEEQLKKELVRGRTGAIVDIIRDIKDEPRLDKRKAQMIYFSAIYTLDNAFAYCWSVNMRETNSLSKLIFDKSNSASLEATSLSTMLSSLNTLEDITSNHFTGEVTRHFVDKAIKKAIKQEREPQSKGGKVRAENYKQNNELAFKHIEELWDTGQWAKASKCAEDIFNLKEIELPYTTVYNHLRSYIKSKK
ncbi:hypothetical protein [Acinetobacter sp. YH12142]|uniref:hypothetical protein n=1 Tax=Acinetobacter sp. YH12142 TaxID=2601126 RepID=UPI0015D34708|nr:hypothetical protein [Acinetobacter sp. YH12142]